MPAPPPVASSPAAAPAPPATGGQEGPAGPPSPRRSTADETGPVFLDEGGDGDGPGPQRRPVPGPEPAASGGSPGPAPARPQSGPGQSSPPQGGFGPPAADPRGDWGGDARAAERTEREPGPAPEAPQPGGREKTVGLRRSEVLRTGDRTPQAGAPAHSAPAADAAAPGGAPSARSAPTPDAAAEGGASGAAPVPDPAPNRPVSTAVNLPGQSAPAAASAPSGGAAAIPAQSQAPENGRPSAGGSAPDRVEPNPSGTGGAPAPAPGQTPGSGRPAPAQGAAGAVAERPGQQTALGAGPVALPAQQGPPAGLAPVPGPGQDQAGHPPAARQSGRPPELAAPSWSQPAGSPAQPQSPGQDVVTPWRPPADDPFARAAQQEVRPGSLGMRLGARLVDLVLTLGVAVGAAFPFVDRTIDHIDAKVEAVEQAGVTQRVWLVDGTTGGYLALVLGAVLVFGLVYEVLPTARWGRTLGKKLFGISVVNIEGYGKPSFGKAVLRWLVHGVLGLLVVGVVNAAWCLFDRPWRQCWHDKVAGTFVAKGRAGGGELRL
ncbi:RDD family protein [Streptomyces sp. NPDC006992]|uniref:RDD family protein n=1 Tax=unclassified Streptomyces TaxID=2593676 RepID=UPI0034017698